MSRGDLKAVCLAAGVAAGAWWAAPVPLVVVLAAAVVALATGRPWLWVLAGVLAASLLAARAHEGLAPPERREVRMEVVLAGDPEPAFGAVRADVRDPSGRRCQAVARGAAGGVLGDLLTGEVVQVEGRIEPLEAPHLAVRHIACRLVVEEAVATSQGALPFRAANLLRRTLVAGGGSLPHELRSLYTGFLLGDSRGQPPEVVDDFRATGLTHLLVVSGQNVAFLLVCAGPLLVRLAPWPRFAAVTGLLASFALLTRFEPSVMRATAMAGLAALASGYGRRASGLRLLAGAVAVVLLLDPFLVRSVGFGLSVGASAGILVASGPVADALPGPGLITRPVGVVLGAQLGVAPVLLPIFGGVPVASLPANLLAGPVSGFIVVWGLTAGLLAGIAASLGSPFDWVASLAVLPLRVALSWVATVARQAAGLGLGDMTWQLGLVATVGGAAAVVSRRSGRRALSVVSFLTILVSFSFPALTSSAPGPGHHHVAGLGEVWVGGGSHDSALVVLVLDAGATPVGVLESSREAHIERIDLLVSTSGGSAAGSRVTALRHRVEVGEVWAPSGHRIAGAVTPERGRRSSGGVGVDVVDVGDRLDVRVELVGDPPGGDV